MSHPPGSLASSTDTPDISISSTSSKSGEHASTNKRAGFWRTFLSTFGAIFLAEVGDKTQVATLLMSAESGNPLVVFLGAGAALVMTSLIGVALGQWLARKVSPHVLDTTAGTVLLVITVWLLWDVVQS